jgi:hypothetical protein
MSGGFQRPAQCYVPEDSILDFKSWQYFFNQLIWPIAQEDFIYIYEMMLWFSYSHWFISFHCHI